jgi:uncharacterized protein (DUF433 family)
MASIINRGRGPEIQGTRITVYRIMDFLREGADCERIAAELSLSEEELRAALDYIDAHRLEVESQYEPILRRLEVRRSSSESPHVRAEELKQRILARSCRQTSHASPIGQ